jgi:hypothetical protein
MKRMILGVLVGVGLMMAAAAMAQQRGDGFGQRAAPVVPAASAPMAAVAGTELIVAPVALNDKIQMLTVVDPKQRALCVYHIDMMTGEIALKSVRNIQWDLRIHNMNTKEPLPQQIRSQLEQK